MNFKINHIFSRYYQIYADYACIKDVAKILVYAVVVDYQAYLFFIHIFRSFSSILSMEYLNVVRGMFRLYCER